MGCVYLGRDHQLGRHVAIKTLIAGADSDLVVGLGLDDPTPARVAEE